MNMMYLNFLLKKPIVNFYTTYTAKTVKQKFETNIPRKETARTRSQFLILWPIYIFPRSVCLFCCRKNMWTDRRNMYSKNRSQKHECGYWDWCCAVSFLGVHK